MEGLGPIDALLLPLLAGTTLASLYFLIQWLEDPALLNKILNWYFAVFGVLSLAQMIKDTLSIIASFIFPETYNKDGNIWELDAKQRKTKVTSSPSVERDSPVPESAPPLPSKVTKAMWTLRDVPSRQLDVRVYIYKIVQARFKIGPQGITSFFLSVAALFYFNLIDKPWWLTNLLGFGFAYSALQIMSPTTSWTGTLILGALFIYDIYFVFYTPLMVTVATQLDIPAKLLFPRPRRPTEDPTKQALFMLGLGDIILPGMMIGFALRFDLYLFYLRKQTRRIIKDAKSTKDDSASKKVDNSEVVKATWHPATGGWGERFWTPKNDVLRSERFQGALFPKTYFRACVLGYVLGMLCTLGVMDIYGRAQPALLYLVPCVLGSFWGTALLKGDIKTLWAFDESQNDGEHDSPSKSEKQDSPWKTGSWMNVGWKNLLFNPPEKPNSSQSHGESPSTRAQSGDTKREETEKSPVSENGHIQKKAEGVFDRDRKSELIFISINFPRPVRAMGSASKDEMD